MATREMRRTKGTENPNRSEADAYHEPTNKPEDQPEDQGSMRETMRHTRLPPLILVSSAHVSARRRAVRIAGARTIGGHPHPDPCRPNAFAYGCHREWQGMPGGHTRGASRSRCALRMAAQGVPAPPVSPQPAGVMGPRPCPMGAKPIRHRGVQGVARGAVGRTVASLPGPRTSLTPDKRTSVLFRTTTLAGVSVPPQGVTGSHRAKGDTLVPLAGGRSQNTRVP